MLFAVVVVVTGCEDPVPEGADGGMSGTAGTTSGAGGTAGAGVDATGGAGGAGGAMDGANDTGAGAAGTGGAGGAGAGGAGAGAGGTDAGSDAGAAGSDGGASCDMPLTQNLNVTPGVLVQGQSFNETRAMRVTPSSDVVVSALIVDGLIVNSAGTVGARIYDVATQALVASGAANVAVSTSARVEVSLTATLIATKAYMVGFFIDAGGSANGGLFEPTALPYTAGPFSVTGMSSVNEDVYPANTNIYAPQMSIKTCGNGGDAGGTVDASSGDGGDGSVAQDGGDGGVAQCNSITLTGARIMKTTHAGPPPVMTGGEVTLGTYVLTAMDKYNGTTGSNTRRETWVISAGHLEVASDDSESGNIAGRFSAGFSTTGNGVTLSGSCPASGAFSAEYTATPTQFMLLSEPLSSDQEIHVFTKQ